MSLLKTAVVLQVNFRATQKVQLLEGVILRRAVACCGRSEVKDKPVRSLDVQEDDRKSYTHCLTTDLSKFAFNGLLLLYPTFFAAPEAFYIDLGKRGAALSPLRQLRTYVLRRSTSAFILTTLHILRHLP
jgi:hypothetical protein